MGSSPITRANKLSILIMNNFKLKLITYNKYYENY